MKADKLFQFIHERHSIYLRRQEGQPKPWTADPILQRYRFCNVYRELDTVTAWITAYWRTPHAADEYLWFAMIVARLFNRPDTLACLGYPVPWNSTKMLYKLRKRRAQGLRLFSGAYMVTTNGEPMDKIDYLSQYVFAPLWRKRNAIAATYYKATTLAEMWEALMQYDGMGSFMAAQIIADLKYVKPLLLATDWQQWAAPGPGSQRGLNRVCGRDLQERWKPGAWLGRLQVLQTKIDPLMRAANMPRLHAQDLQNCLCEFDKYERVRLGQGRPKQLYDGTGVILS